MVPCQPADKRIASGQHCRMHIECPKCYAGYRLDQIDVDAILVCHRCGHEFRMSDAREVKKPVPESAAVNAEPAMDDEQPASAPDIPLGVTKSGSVPAADSSPIVPDRPGIQSQPVDVAPAQKGGGLWPWFLIVLLIIAAAGFWINRDAWLADPWLRSVLMNMDIPIKVQDTDWRIIPESVHSQWVRRDDGRHVLVIEGRVKNLLQTDLPPPRLKLSLFAAEDANRLLSKQILPITQPPLLGAIRKAPYSPPPLDTVPVTARGERGFILVLEDAPATMGDFTLQPVAR